ncbi:unnamed protein product [Alopecurus aequalis]
MAQSGGRTRQQGSPETETAACEIERLPEELLAAAISLCRSPPDACRAAAVSRAFRPAADSDAVWSRFLPRDLPQFAQGELPCTPPSKKALFRCLADQPALLPCRLVSMWLDRATGAKCYMLSARALQISWGDTPDYWEWIDLGCEEVKSNKRFGSFQWVSWANQSSYYLLRFHGALCHFLLYSIYVHAILYIYDRFLEAAKLLGVWWLEIRGKINSMMLSHNLTYAAYMVFKLADDGFDLLDFPFQEASVSAGSDSKRQVCLQSYMEVGDDGVPLKHILTSSDPTYHHPEVPLTDDIILPRKRADGWIEVELGDFYNEEGYNDEVSFRLIETKEWKHGLVVWGIEIRS